MTSEQLETIRTQQTKAKVTPGIYGKHSIRRDKTPEEILEKLRDEEQGKRGKDLPPSTFHLSPDVLKNFVIRFRSPGELGKRIVFEDVIKGSIETMENINDIVLIKSDALPTYHLAHIVDDYLMRVSHVIR